MGEWAGEGGGLPVVAWAGPDLQVPLEPGSQTQAVTLDGSGSFSNLGLELTYSWQEDGNEVGAGSQIQIDLEPGVHTFVLQATDTQGNLGADTVTVTVGQDAVLGSCGAIGPPALAFGFISLTALAATTRMRMTKG